MTASVQGLLEAFAQAHPRRATGGIYAMAGFVFQAELDRTPLHPAARAVLDATLAQLAGRAVQVADAGKAGDHQARQVASALYHATTAAAMLWQAAPIDCARRMRLAQWVLRSRLLPQYPLALDAQPDWLADLLKPQGEADVAVDGCNCWADLQWLRAAVRGRPPTLPCYHSKGMWSHASSHRANGGERSPALGWAAPATPLHFSRLRLQQQDQTKPRWRPLTPTTPTLHAPRFSGRQPMHCAARSMRLNTSTSSSACCF